MKRRLLILVLLLLAVLFPLALQRLFRLTEPFPHLWLRITTKVPEVQVVDLEGDGSDEAVFYDQQGKKGWLLKWHQGRLRLQPLQPLPLVGSVPLAGTVSEIVWEGKYAIGKTKQKEIAIAELQSDGQWRTTILAKDAISYSIGDLDSDGQNDDAVLLISQTEQKGKLIWFQRQKNGQWQKFKEMALPTPQGLSAKPFLFVDRSKVSIHYRVITQQIVFQQGNWWLSDKGTILFGDWDGDRKQDVLRFQWQPNQNRLNLELRSTRWRQTFRQTKQFPLRQLVGHASTDELGDSVQHLLLALHGGKGVSLIDGVFAPSGWRWKELATFSVPKLLQDDRFFFHVGDADGDGDKDLVAELALARRGTFLPSLPRPKSQFWLLRREQKTWSVQPIQLQQNESLYCNRIGDRLWLVKETIKQRLVGPKWHFIYSHMVIEVINQIFTFRSDGKLQIIAQVPGELKAIDDLNGDGFPELITRQPFNVEPFEPAWFWSRSPNGRWQGFEVSIPIKFRRLAEGIWAEVTNGMQLGRYFNRTITLRWGSKKWFLLVWNDGLLQAVTVKD
ncbi:MAG: hypothetical protein NZ805_03105 [Armatimonadetes bacterium]|nr:hypothetical protein [Armatimonadota bacterium]MDW8027874.1 hypothetical protein [Armatimonadota bacterium]